MESLLYVIIALLVVVMAAVWVLASRRREAGPSADSLGLLQGQLADSLGRQDQRLGQLSEQLAKSLDAMRLQTGERLDKVGSTMGDLRQQLGQLGEAAKGIQQVGSEVRQLQDILQSPKLRGNLGEWSLENLLAEVLPRDAYHLQYSFRSGNKVDALVELASGKVCIDAKFPLENFRAMLEAGDESTRQKQRKVFLRDVKKRIDEIAQRYIVPDEGTLDFALMYIPAENVYYETIISHSNAEPDINAYGREKKVFAVSPNLLYGYLMIIATGLKGLQIEKNAKRIYQQLTRLGNDLGTMEEDFQTLGKHLNNAKAKYDDTGRKLDQFGLQLRSLESHNDPE